MRSDVDATEELRRQVETGRVSMISWKDASMISRRLYYLEAELDAARNQIKRAADEAGKRGRK